MLQDGSRGSRKQTVLTLPGALVARRTSPMLRELAAPGCHERVLLASSTKPQTSLFAAAVVGQIGPYAPNPRCELMGTITPATPLAAPWPFGFWGALRACGVLRG